MGVVALETGEMRVIDLADGQQIVESVASAHDGTFVVKVVVPYLDSTPVVVTGGSDGVVRVWTWEDSLIEVDSHAVPDVVTSLDIVSGRRLLAVCGPDLLVFSLGDVRRHR